jgi:putative zinc finger/helix-turn-helix YgiT family protein
MDHDGRTYEFTVPDLVVLKCAACEEQVLPPESRERIYAKLREEAGLLAPEDIRDKRIALGLTQEQLANQLGVAKETVSRWETGGQIQQRGYDKLLRVYFHVAEAREYLGIASKTVSPPQPDSKQVEGGGPLPSATDPPATTPSQA